MSSKCAGLSPAQCSQDASFRSLPRAARQKNTEASRSIAINRLQKGEPRRTNQPAPADPNGKACVFFAWSNRCDRLVRNGRSWPDHRAMSVTLDRKTPYAGPTPKRTRLQCDHFPRCPIFSPGCGPVWPFLPALPNRCRTDDLAVDRDKKFCENRAVPTGRNPTAQAEGLGPVVRQTGASPNGGDVIIVSAGRLAPAIRRVVCAMSSGLS